MRNTFMPIPLMTVGNMQTTGDGLIIAVGGPAGLPNPDPAPSPVHVAFGWSAADAVRFVKYGVCTDTPDQNVNPNFTSFDLSANQLSDCTLSFIDNQSPANLYLFRITNQPPYPSRPPDGQPIPALNKTMIDCTGNTRFITDTWCRNIFAYTQSVLGRHKKEDDYVSVPARAQPPRPVPQPFKKLSISVAGVTQQGARADVQFAVQNSGTTEITTVEISDVQLRMLAGAGVLKLIDPLPIRIPKLAPGTTTSIVLGLDTPETVKRPALTESGLFIRMGFFLTSSALDRCFS